MHRGHAWVFRAESYDTMMAWFDDIANLSEKTGEARNAFVRRHIRSLSGNSYRASSISSDGVMDEDEADQTPYSSQSAVLRRASSVKGETPAQRPQPGGRFPSDVQIDRHLQATMSRSSGESSGAREALADAVALPGSGVPFAPNQETHDLNDYNASTHGQLPYRTVDGGNDTAYETWTAAATSADHYPDYPQNYVHDNSQQEQFYRQQPVTSPSQAPIVVNNEENTTNNEWSSDLKSAEAPASTMVYVIDGQAPDAGASSLKRHESQRSRQTHSTYSLMASTPASEATSPFPDNTAAMPTRPNPQSKASASTIDMLKMPGNYPRPVAN